MSSSTFVLVFFLGNRIVESLRLVKAFKSNHKNNTAKSTNNTLMGQQLPKFYLCLPYWSPVIHLFYVVKVYEQ